MGHLVHAEAYHPPVIRTGYESVIANRTTDMFAVTAKSSGKVISVAPNGIVVEYDDKSQRGVTLGRTYGKAEGSIYPHDVVTDMKEGQKFNKGEPIAYNSGFFERDSLDPTHIVMKSSKLTKVALCESTQTHEDSCAISSKLGVFMTAKTTKMKSFIIDFKQNLNSVAKPGQALTPKSLLMVIEDEIIGGNNSFDEETLTALRNLSNQAPRSSYLGILDKVEVYYHGDKADMSTGLRALSDRSDKLMAENCKASGSPVVTGQVTDDYRVSGVPLTLDKAEVRFFITVKNTVGVGDKLVTANQLKTVVGEVMDYSVTAEDGTEIDMIFGGRSTMARIVTSPFVIGTSATLLQVIQKQACSIYRGQ